jgi:hypothetical protein
LGGLYIYIFPGNKDFIFNLNCGRDINKDDDVGEMKIASFVQNF